MILTYLWIDEPNLKPEDNLGYNFYGKYTFKFNKDKKTLYFEENKNYIDNFYKKEKIDIGCIESLTCIVGSNGSGKTTLINYLVDLLTPNEYIKDLNLVNRNIFALFIDKNHNKEILYYFYNNQDSKLIIKEKTSNYKEIKIKIEDKSLCDYFSFNNIKSCNYNSIVNKYIKDIAVFHYSNFVDEININTLDYHDRNLFDLQTKKLIINYKFKHKLYFENDIFSKFNVFQLEEFNNIFDFLLEYNTILIKQFFKGVKRNNLKFLIRDKITFEPFFDNYNNYDYLKINFTTRFGDDSIERNIFKRVNEFIKHKIKDPSSFYNLKKLDKKDFQKKFVYNILWQFTLSIWFLLEILVLNEKYINITEELYNYYFENDYLPTIKTPQECIKRIFNFVKQILEDNEKNNYKYDNIKSNILLFFNLIMKYSSNCFISFYNEEIIDPTKNNKLILDVKNKKIILDFIDKYKNSIKDFPFGNYCKFGWLPQMSSGEYSLITLLSRLFAAIKEAVKDKNYLLILIDEGEIGFHPYWQKRYIASLIEFFETTLKIVKKENVKIQLIITTNNPIPLSDVQPNDIIYLESHKVKELKNKKAFGTDLLTLYSDSFFINDGLIGIFADSKIKELINRCKKQKKLNEKEIIYYKKLANNVGDNFIKQYLLELIQNKEKTNA